MNPPPLVPTLLRGNGVLARCCGPAARHSTAPAPRERRRQSVPPQERGNQFRSCFGLVVLRLFGGIAGADDPPVRGRPLRFSGAVGTFRVATTVDRDEVRVGDPFLLTIRVTATGGVREPPTRPDLGDLPAFADAFHVGALPDPKDR